MTKMMTMMMIFAEYLTGLAENRSDGIEFGVRLQHHGIIDHVVCTLYLLENHLGWNHYHVSALKF